MTAVFGTPIAAVMLAVELLLFELRATQLPAGGRRMRGGRLRRAASSWKAGALFPLQTEVLGPVGLVSCAVAGVITGALSWGLSTSLYKMEDLFLKLPFHWMWWPALGGLAIGIGGYFQPRALGVGYDVIGDLLHNHLAVGVVVGGRSGQGGESG